jgi:hypothetical protein
MPVWTLRDSQQNHSHLGPRSQAFWGVQQALAQTILSALPPCGDPLNSVQVQVTLQRNIISTFVKKNWEWILLAAGALGALLFYRDYGLCWDAEVNAAYGERVLNYFLSGFSDKSCNTAPGVLHFYGTLFELPSAALHRALGLDPHALRALLTAFTGLLTLPPLIQLGRKLGGERTAFFSALALLLMPQFFGHSFINAKDIPLACAVAWSVLALHNLMSEDEPSWRAMLWLGVTFGLVLAIRVGAIFIFVYLAGAIVLRRLPIVMEHGWKSFLPEKEKLWPLRRKAWTAVALIWLIVVALWPYAHENPLLNPFRAYRVATAFPNIYEVLFAGKLIPSNELPRSYLPVYFVLVTPPALLVLGLLGALQGVITLARRWRKPEGMTVFLILLWIGFPVFYVLAAHPNIYDTIRHFLFVLPAFALLIGWSAAQASCWVENRFGKITAWSAALLVLGLTAVPLFRWHPYQYAYLNFLAGDRATLHERYETDYWVTSYKAAAEWLNKQQANSSRPLQVLVAANDHSLKCFSHFADKRIQTTDFMGRSDDKKLPDNFDYAVSTVRYGLDKNFPESPVVWEERRDGVLFSVIRGQPKETAK